jgi:hypothetical protein
MGISVSILIPEMRHFLKNSNKNTHTCFSAISKYNSLASVDIIIKIIIQLAVHFCFLSKVDICSKFLSLLIVLYVPLVVMGSLFFILSYSSMVIVSVDQLRKEFPLPLEAETLEAAVDNYCKESRNVLLSQ